ncbi:MAG TPA: helix-turn-helix transcriptional regulator [Thermoanaerobaculia bacterium]|nr:helix-turn-helix transcriptional regulator [Thermoanaerobaculia bacterium]
METRDLTHCKDGEPYRELVSALAAKLREVRKERGMNLAELARELGTHVSYLFAMESARPYASVDGLIRTLIALGVSRSELAGAIAGPGEGAPE